MELNGGDVGRLTEVLPEVMVVIDQRLTEEKGREKQVVFT